MIKQLIPIAIKDKLKTTLKRIVNGSELAYPSTSHCGEDRILAYLLKKRRNGFFIDIGAFHPITSSNTYAFYKQGWRGINIDPFPGSMNAFKALRPEDINLEIGIGPEETELIYYKIGEGHHQMNGFNPDFQKAHFEEFGIDPSTVKQIPIKVYPIKNIFDKWLKPNQVIDFMSIDVEGFEETILRSNDWTKYRPIVVMIEDHRTIKDVATSVSLLSFMNSNNYTFVFKTPNEIIFLNNDYSLNKSAIVIL